ncbi:hypothetical protein M407DRAFT_24503 [Tulasnella calospora MUT 4182]|uniref:Uncharacterized protein n=1 Tax=Tulasnella calospora MUT 4182 TaxID=1051891 RepID=A0A0C3Q8L0_9AGAM|nr:hypothetical protein M407DRAFT_24503 [Tulasnella calospora MUT 4182]
MKNIYQKTIGKVGSVGANISLSTLMEILGRKRVRIAFQLWGASDEGGKVECDEEIKERMANWIELNPGVTPLEASYHRIKVVQAVRKAKFKREDDDVKAKWTKRAKSIHKPATIEEEQCFVEAALPYVVDLLKVLAERGNMHFVLLASGKGSCDIPIVIQEMVRKDVHNDVFIAATSGLGARVRADYIAFALDKFGGGVEDATIRLDTGEADDVADGGEDEDDNEDLTFATGMTKGQGNKPVAVFVPPFKPDLTQTKSVQQMEKAINDFIFSGIKMLHRIRPSWDKLTRFASTYIDPKRMPMDPDVPNQRLQLQKPSAMSETRVKVFFKFLISSYDGTLPEVDSFRFKLEYRHLNIPQPGAPADPHVHHAGAAIAKTKVPKRKRGESNTKEKQPKRRRNEQDAEEGDYEEYEDYEGMMQDVNAAFLDDALALSAAVNGQAKGARKGKALRIESPPQSPPNVRKASGPKTSEPEKGRSVTISQPKLTGDPPDKPAHRKRPKARPKSVIEVGTDELSHSELLPDDEETARAWMETKKYLDVWGGNMSYCDEQSRKMPFKGLSGFKHSINLPAGLYSSVSILQLWSVFQTDSTGDFDVTFLPNLGLGTVDAAHHISKIISLITDSSQPLPSARYVYTQSGISSDAAYALFLQIEKVVSRFMDEMIASETSILSLNLDLLQGMRLACFMAGTGFIRDVGEKAVNTERTSALSDRFVQTVAAIAFARYMSLVLGRVASLYARSSSGSETESMWAELEFVWSLGCRTLARALMRLRSDIFLVVGQRASLPRNFLPLLEYAFESRPWWTPSPNGAPGILSITNKQSVASEPFFKYLKALNWTTSTFIERGQVLLLLFIAAIQIETGRVVAADDKVESPAIQFTKALKSLRKVVEDSGEIGPTEQPIIVPDDSVATWVGKWEMECQILVADRHKSSESSSQRGVPPTIIDKPTVPSIVSPKLDSTKRDENLPEGENDEAGRLASSGILSGVQASEDLSVISYEPEDPVFTPVPQQDTNPSTADQLPLPSSSDEGAAVIPAVRPLEDAPLPPPKKKRRNREVVLSIDEVDQGPRRLRSATAPQPAQAVLPRAPARQSTPKKGRTAPATKRPAVTPRQGISKRGGR